MREITISEYGFIGCDNVNTDDNKFVGVRNLEPEIFEELYNFWLEDKETQKVFTFENKHCLKATSYVGVIQTKNLSIEILPKIYKKGEEELHRHIFIEMLKPLLKTPTKEKLDEIFRVNIIPLLAEYFYGDWADIEFILNNNFIQEKKKKEYIKESSRQFNRVYEVNDTFEKTEYIKIYNGDSEEL